jgi:hypothetical protein
VIKRLVYISFLLSICFTRALGQLPQSLDSSYIKQFKRQNNIQLNNWLTHIDFRVNPIAGNTDYQVIVTPNVRNQIGVSFGLKKITLFAGFQVPGTDRDVNTFGKTKYTDFSFGYFKDRYGGEIYYRNYDGLYTNEMVDAPRTIRPDARLTNFGINFYVTFNRKFSYRSAIVQQELQTKSSGTFVLMANVNYRGLSSDTSIIPRQIDTREIFNELQGLVDIRFYVANLRPGYAHNFVAKGGKWFFCPSVFAGIGIGNYEYRAASGVSRGTTADLTAQGKLSAGYNNKLVFWNIYLMYDRASNSFGSKSSASLQSVNFGVNIGYRLNSYFKIKWL